MVIAGDMNPAASDDRYYVHQPDGPPIGPVTLDLLARGIAAGKVPVDTLVCRVGSSDWLPAQAVVGLPPMTTPPDHTIPSAPSGTPSPPNPTTVPKKSNLRKFAIIVGLQLVAFTGCVVCAATQGSREARTHYDECLRLAAEEKEEARYSGAKSECEAAVRKDPESFGGRAAAAWLAERDAKEKALAAKRAEQVHTAQTQARLDEEARLARLSTDPLWIPCVREILPSLSGPRREIQCDGALVKLVPEKGYIFIHDLPVPPAGTSRAVVLRMGPNIAGHMPSYVKDLLPNLPAPAVSRRGHCGEVASDIAKNGVENCQTLVRSNEIDAAKACFQLLESTANETFDNCLRGGGLRCAVFQVAGHSLRIAPMIMASTGEIAIVLDGHETCPSGRGWKTAPWRDIEMTGLD
jgi:hypothetical protein